ncbi:hypothetical protein ACFQV7_13070 [Leucobacter soli]|uniref:hypothetical protein n=1 Tax=Leucobacter soli TaxID=2812850 RepID=UPI003610B5AD
MPTTSSSETGPAVGSGVSLVFGVSDVLGVVCSGVPPPWFIRAIAVPIPTSTTSAISVISGQVQALRFFLDPSAGS